MAETKTVKKTVKKPKKTAEAPLDVVKDRYFTVVEDDRPVMCGACGAMVLEVETHDAFHRVVAPQ